MVGPRRAHSCEPEEIAELIAFCLQKSENQGPSHLSRHMHVTELCHLTDRVRDLCSGPPRNPNTPGGNP